MTSSAMPVIDLSVIIVNWNTINLTTGCVSTVEAEGAGPSAPKLETIVVDNGSTDGSALLLAERFPQIHVIQNQQNVGFARANNQALAACNGRYILLLNSDTEVHRGALRRLVDFMDDHPAIGAAGPMLLNPDKSLQVSCYPFPNLGREAWRLFHLDRLQVQAIYPMTAWSTETPRPVDIIQGACIILRRSVVDEVGLFDDDYFMYSEDFDLCMRIHRAGWQCYWVPDAEVVHYGGQSSRQVAARMFQELHRSKVQYFRKHHGAGQAMLYKLLLAGAAAARLILVPLVLLTGGAGRLTRLKLASNYGQLLRSVWGY